jgi:predicted ATPase/DNA-binding XRE family transcriptional regulator
MMDDVSELIHFVIGTEGPMSSEQTPFGTLLKRYRIAAGLTQEALAARAQLSARAISDLERGINRVPRYDTLELLIAALHVTTTQRALLLSTIRPEMTVPAPQTRSVSPPPLPPTALIGREQEMARTLTFLQRDGVRLLTLTGPSGIGKTRLAIQLALDLDERFEQGAVFVALASLRDPALLPATLAQALGLREQTSGSLSDLVCASLQEQHLLLVLDNFEHLLQAAPFVADLLASCPRLQVLVTSRAPLHVRGEQELVIAPLELPAAVALFRARAQAVRPEQDYLWSEVAAICDQVDRLPLAIELAAMHVKVLALPFLLKRLSRRLTLLSQGPQDLPEHQRTLESAIAWSYDLLTAAQQRCFRALGVFVGGWTLEAAEVVCSQEGGLARDEVLLALATLIDHSLASLESSAGGPSRFSMLETLREYALERLREASEEEQTHRQHAIYYAEFAKTFASHRTRELFHDAELMQDLPNLRAALHWFAERRAVVPGLQLAAYAGHFFMILGQNSEGYEWLESMLELDSQAGADAAPVLVRLDALFTAGRLARNLARSERAAALAQEEWELSRRLGDHASMSLALANLGNLAQARGDLAEAADYFEQSYQHAHLGMDWRAQGIALVNLASIAIAQRDFSRAQVLLEERLAQVRAERFDWAIANVLTMLGHVAREQQQYALARSRYRESLLLYRALGNLSYTALCLEGMATLACAEGHYEQAVRLGAHAAALRLKSQTPLPPREQKAFDQMVGAARAALAEAAFNEAWATGSAWTQEEAFTFALSSLSL